MSRARTTNLGETGALVDEELPRVAGRVSWDRVRAWIRLREGSERRYTQVGALRLGCLPQSFFPLLDHPRTAGSSPAEAQGVVGRMVVSENRRLRGLVEVGEKNCRCAR